MCIAFLLVDLTLIATMTGGQAQQVGDCGGVVKNESGSIQTPNYPLNYPEFKVCTWIIEVQPGDKVVLSFESFALEDNAFCDYDYLIIRDGLSSRSPLIGKFCGTSRPATITSTDNYLWILFRSDSSTTSQGFKAVWTSEKSVVLENSPAATTTKSSPTAITSPTTIQNPSSSTPSTPRSSASAAPNSGCGRQLTGNGGVFTSPNYPKSYPISIQCEWRIVTSPGGSVELKFQDFHLENSGSCVFDFVEIRDGARADSPLIGTFCSSMIIGRIVSTGNSLFIKLTSDGTVSEKGFNASWKMVSSEAFTSSTQRFTTPLSTTLTSPTRSECGGVINGENGEISSPGFPKKYPLNKECTWIILAPKGKTIKLLFQEFELEKHSNCRYDYLEVRDGDGPQKFLLGKFCGDIAPNRINSSGNAMYIKFYSDGLIAKRGFIMTWKIIQGTEHTTNPGDTGGKDQVCGGTFTKMDGSMRSPRYPKNYPESITCQWVIKLPAQYKIRLEFTDFVLENSSSCQYDFVFVMDGLPSSPTALGKFCGNGSKDVVESKSNILTVLFKSDSSKTKKGFEAYWSALPGLIEKATSSIPSSKVPSNEVVPTKCGGNYTKPSGDIFSPYYPNPSFETVDCEWVISVYEGNRIAFGFNEFDLDSDDNCNVEYVELRDGGLESSNLLGRYCKSAPMVVIGSQEKMWLKYHSDGTGRIGFEATWMTMAQAIKPMETESGDVDDLNVIGPVPHPPKKCGEALGIESGEIKDAQLSASSSWRGVNSFGAHNARLNSQRWPQGWSADVQDENPWLKVSFDVDYVINGIATQGHGNMVFNEWVESYFVVWLDIRAGEVYYQEDGKVKVFDGNRDHTSVVHHVLREPFITKQMTIRPIAWKENVGLRMELYGCPLDDCQEPLGLQNQNMKGVLTASSVRRDDQQKSGSDSTGPSLSQLPHGWTADAEDLSPWLQVNLKDYFIVTGVATKGYGGKVEQWVETYRLSWKNGEGIWRNYSIPHRVTTSEVQWNTKIFHGNKDGPSLVSHTLGNAIRSSVIRIWPLTKHNLVSMRAELYGCLAESALDVTNCTSSGPRMNGESNPPSKKDCHWFVTSSKDSGTVTLKFTNFDFSRSDPTCTKDFVEVRNGLTEHAPLIGRYCGSSVPSTIQSSGSGLWVRYVVSGEIKTKVGMTYDDGPYKIQPGNDVGGHKGCGTRTYPTPPSQIERDFSKEWSGQWPWHVALLLMGQSVQQCSGALVASRWVLTAAHCFRRFKQPSQWIIRSGEFDLSLHEGFEQDVRAETIYVHSQYKSETNENDIALVYLKRPVEINDKVGVLCMPYQGFVQPGSSCVVAGWGSPSNFHRGSAPLRSQIVPVVSRQHCNKTSSYAGLVKQSMICAGFEEGGKDRCYGDGGGPLMCPDFQGKWFVGGVNSWGQGCGISGKYGVYTLTESYRDWIDRHMQDNY